MSHTFTCLAYHIIFATTDRRNVIPENVQPKIHSYLAGLINNTYGYARCVGGVNDHVHILCDLHPTYSISCLLQNIKCLSSKWIHETFRQPLFSWQQGYSAFAVSVSSIETVKTYIKNQKVHHKGISFREEFEFLLKKNGIEYDP